MSAPTTFRHLAGLATGPEPLAESALVLIDCQREYMDGAVPVPGFDAAVKAAGRVLELARHSGMPVFHVAHRGAPGAAVFDPDGPFCAIVDDVAPAPGEAVVTKATPNAFAGTDLAERLAASGRRQVVFVGFMTHNCISASVRAAFDLGYAYTVVADAVATRDLPDGHGGTNGAAELHRAELAGLADRVATMVDSVAKLRD